MTLAYLHGKPQITGELKTSPEDFIVQELISVQPDGSGEHLWLNIRKRSMNTQFLAKQIANWAQVKERDVAYAGLKDRHAITEQWFSVHLAGKPDPDLSKLETSDIKVLQSMRHSQKIRSPVLIANRFSITLRNVSDLTALEKRYQQIITSGVPNYFGEQRFGINGSNIENAKKMFAGQRVKRNLQSIYISSARSLLFNQIASKRIENGLTNILAGEVLKLAGSNSTFIEHGETDLPQRLANGDIELTAPLWGDSTERMSGEYLAFCQEIAEQEPELCAGLKRAKASLMFRAILLKPQYSTFSAQTDRSAELTFMLQPGSFATSVMRELLAYKDLSGGFDENSN